jgi:hypothetical protein
MIDDVKKSFEPFLNPHKINIEHGIFSIDLVLLLIVSIIIVPYAFYNIRHLVKYPVNSNLNLSDYYVLMILLVYLVIGVYQQYFWTKSNKIRKEKVIHKTKLDEYTYSIFNTNDTWIYIYNFIYYFVFGLIIVSIKDYKHFAVLVLGAISMMTGLSIIWYLYPNVVENRMVPTKYFLKKTQLIDDNKNNACPSAHVVFAMYAFYLLRNVIGYFQALLIPILISISCLTTTQHVTSDILLGILYAVFFYNVILRNINPKIFN